MSRADDRIQVYPDPAALEILNATTKGEVGGTLNLAIEVFADMLAQATEENAKTYTGELVLLSDPDPFTRKEWTRIAEACTDRFGMSSTPIGSRLANCIHRRGETGRFFDIELARKLSELSDLRAWAVVWSLRTYQTRGADLAKDEWWTLKFRTAKEGKGQR